MNVNTIRSLIPLIRIEVRGPLRIAGLSAFIFVAILAACTPHVPGDSDAALALEDIAAGFGGSRLKDQTPRPEPRTIDFNVEGRAYQGDLYLSSQATRAGIVLVPGVVPRGKDDGRIVALAQTLARLQFAVLVPDLQGPRHRVRGAEPGFQGPDGSAGRGHPGAWPQRHPDPLLRKPHPGPSFAA